MTWEQGDRAPPHHYELRVRGHLGETMRLAFPDLGAEWRSDDTVLRGDLPDLAALYGVISRLEALGLELLEVRQVSGGPS
ncbi:MAG: hypothetical protein QOF00_3275 [Pseudonocardiales bacterium]|jgi:hypothetical protein|nr:hypothetical protein [Pseudonocardiales bacterium]